MPKYCTLSILLRIVEAFPFLSTFDYLTTLTYQRVVLDSSAHKVSAYLFPFNPIIVLFFFFFRAVVNLFELISCDTSHST